MGKPRSERIGSRLASGAAPFVLMIVGVVTFIILSDKPYGVQVATAIVYSFGILYLVFFPNKLGTGFEFTSSAVKCWTLRLLLRHIFILALLIVFLSIALNASPHLPVWLTKENRRHRTGLESLLMFMFIVVGVVQATQFRNILRKEELKQIRQKRLR